jgi:hypothetical protein
VGELGIRVCGVDKNIPSKGLARDVRFQGLVFKESYYLGSLPRKDLCENVIYQIAPLDLLCFLNRS